MTSGKIKYLRADYCFGSDNKQHNKIETINGKCPICKVTTILWYLGKDDIR